MQTLARILCATVTALIPWVANSQNLPVKWEELTAPDFVKAIQQSQGVCVLPFGIIEKHGPQLPLGTDLINIRYLADHAAEQEYAVVFPDYYFGQIFEARHEPGTLAYSARLQLDLLQETTDEMGRNGCRKIIIANGHGGNNSLLPYFAQSQMAAPHEYVVYIYTGGNYPPGRPELKSKTDAHAGESETAHTMISRPDLVHQDRATTESGADLNREDLPKSGIWWYAKFPNHYAGDGAAATKELGDFDMKASTANLANAIRAIKADNVSPRLQQEFYDKAKHRPTLASKIDNRLRPFTFERTHPNRALMAVSGAGLKLAAGVSHCSLPRPMPSWNDEVLLT